MYLIEVISVGLKHFYADILYEVIALVLVKAVFFGLCEPVADTVPEYIGSIVGSF